MTPLVYLPDDPGSPGGGSPMVTYHVFCSPGGSINPPGDENGEVQLPEGNQTFTYSANPGYIISEVWTTNDIGGNPYELLDLISFPIFQTEYTFMDIYEGGGGPGIKVYFIHHGQKPCRLSYDDLGVDSNCPPDGGKVLPEVAARIAKGDRRFMPEVI
jgi:hypothetical protein